MAIPVESLHRYDFLFIAALVIQGLLLASRLETLTEAKVILLFHLVATAMEVFKTSPSIQSWIYSGEAVLRIGNVPLFAGFMYSAVGSYIARIWRIFRFDFTAYPDLRLAALAALLIYLNFFGHHFIWDFRWALMAMVAVLYWRARIYFTVLDRPRSVPLLLGLVWSRFSSGWPKTSLHLPISGTTRISSTRGAWPLSRSSAPGSCS